MQPMMIRTWRYRINRLNKNLLIIICGATGTGKSFSAMTIAKLIDPTFNVKDRIVFTIEQFMELLGSRKLKRGNVVVWDEAGVGIPAREWYSISNKAINYVLQTFRHLNLCVIFTTPSFAYIDKQTRLLFHVYIEALKIDTHKNRVICKVMENQFNPAIGKEYRKYFFVKGIKKERINIGRPTQDMIADYEDLKLRFSNKLREDVSKDVHHVQEQLTAKRITDEEIQDYLRNLSIRPTTAEVQRNFKIGKDRAYFNLITVFGKAKRGRPQGTMNTT